MKHTYIYILTLRHTPSFSQSAYITSKPQITWNNAFSVRPKRKNSQVHHLDEYSKVCFKKRGYSHSFKITCDKNNGEY